MRNFTSLARLLEVLTLPPRRLVSTIVERAPNVEGEWRNKRAKERELFLANRMWWIVKISLQWLWRIKNWFSIIFLWSPKNFLLTGRRQFYRSAWARETVSFYDSVSLLLVYETLPVFVQIIGVIVSLTPNESWDDNSILSRANGIKT